MYDHRVAGHTNEPLPDLTDVEQRLLNFITSHVTTKGYPPTIRECLPVGPWTSPSAVSYHLNALSGKRRIHRGPGPRMITILTGPDTEDPNG